MNAAKLVGFLSILLSCLASAAGQPSPSPVPSGDAPGITRTIDASQYFRPFPDLVAYRNTSIQKAPAPAARRSGARRSSARRKSPAAG